MFNGIPRPRSLKLIHPFNTLDLEGIEIVVRGAFWLSHKNDIDWLMLEFEKIK